MFTTAQPAATFGEQTGLGLEIGPANRTRVVESEGGSWLRLVTRLRRNGSPAPAPGRGRGNFHLHGRPGALPRATASAKLARSRSAKAVGVAARGARPGQRFDQVPNRGPWLAAAAASVLIRWRGRVLPIVPAVDTDQRPASGLDCQERRPPASGPGAQGPVQHQHWSRPAGGAARRRFHPITRHGTGLQGLGQSCRHRPWPPARPL